MMSIYNLVTVELPNTESEILLVLEILHVIIDCKPH